MYISQNPFSCLEGKRYDNSSGCQCPEESESCDFLKWFRLPLRCKLGYLFHPIQGALYTKMWSAVMNPHHAQQGLVEDVDEQGDAYIQFLAHKALGGQWVHKEDYDKLRSVADYP